MGTWGKLSGGFIMFAALRTRVAPRVARATRSYGGGGSASSGGEWYPGHPGDGLGGAKPSVTKEIAIASGLGVVSAIWWLNVIGHERSNAVDFWKNYKPDTDDE